MQMPSPRSALLLVWLLLFLPWMSWKSARKFEALKLGLVEPGSKPMPSRSRIFAGTLYMLVLLFVLAWLASYGGLLDLFYVDRLGQREVLAGAGALAVALGLRYLGRLMRTDDERRKLAVYRLMPRTNQEWVLYLALAVAAGIAEEAAYRGVGMFVLSDLLGNPWLAAAILSVAFGLAHLLQEWKSVVIIIAVAALMHALVQFTGTLVIAMAVHATYDIIAGILGANDARRLGILPPVSPGAG